MAKGKVTSSRAASVASRVLRNPKSKQAERTAAASALSQKPPKKAGK